MISRILNHHFQGSGEQGSVVMKFTHDEFSWNSQQSTQRTHSPVTSNDSNVGPRHIALLWGQVTAQHPVPTFALSGLKA